MKYVSPKSRTYDEKCRIYDENMFWGFRGSCVSCTSEFNSRDLAHVNYARIFWYNLKYASPKCETYDQKWSHTWWKYVFRFLRSTGSRISEYNSRDPAHVNIRKMRQDILYAFFSRKCWKCMNMISNIFHILNKKIAAYALRVFPAETLVDGLPPASSTDVRHSSLDVEKIRT